MMGRMIGRLWYYFRIGFATYIAFILTFLGSTSAFYYLAIKAIPAMESIFPSYALFLIIMILTGTPFAIMVGRFHFKKSKMFTSEIEIQAESNLFNFRTLPGRESQVIVPTQALLNLLLIKLAKESKLLSVAERECLLELTRRWHWLAQGKDIRKYKPTLDIDINKVIKEMLENEINT